MTAFLTFVTAVGPYHTADNARSQVAAQTVECEHIVVHDPKRKGPGWARNVGLADVTTEFVAFLDADDQVAPTWAEETLAAFVSGGGRRYIYTDHHQDGQIVKAPNCPWVRATWHVITSFVPTDWWRHTGGFDETLPAFEDTDAFMRLITSGYCGRRLARPLFTYGAGGQRSARWADTPAYHAAMRYFSKNYGGRNVGSCCGDPQPGDQIAVGERLDGDVMAEATWAGNRPQRGRVSGRVYRTGNWKRTWVDPRDVDNQPELWRIVREDTSPAPDFDFSSFADYAARTGDHGQTLTGVQEISDFFMRETKPSPDYQPPPEAVRVEDAPSGEKPSADALRKKAQHGKRAARQRTNNVAHKAANT